ncbi:MAG TPA: hypothetical protein VK190_02440 [Pseudoneobacillus sp.]|nr:hypothetical protein [Pseudoneobacillus sp.]
MFRKIRHFYYTIVDGIKNIIYWLPVIWNDEEFDFCHFETIMLHKLKKMEKFFRSKYAWSVDCGKTADEIAYAISLLERIHADHYLVDALKPFDAMYPDNEPFTIEHKEGSHFGRLVNTDTLEQKKFKHQCYAKADEARERDIDEFYIYLKDHFEKW